MFSVRGGREGWRGGLGSVGGRTMERVRILGLCLW